ncbi:MAG: hypothetical protein JAY74_11665, partial [Candidatus Thiodiazotropha taylori]|nr:hypothetical protein [Candidatus Thiodiazotropha taylori]
MIAKKFLDALFRILILLTAGLSLVTGSNAFGETPHSSNMSMDASIDGLSDLESANKLQTTLYSCPMHPNETSDKPGSCSICGMHLVAQSGADHSGHDHHQPMTQSSTDHSGHDHQSMTQSGTDHSEHDHQPMTQSGTDHTVHDHHQSMTHSDHVSEDHQTIYACPMHPNETSDEPGRCSICGMHLVAQTHTDHSGHDHHQPTTQSGTDHSGHDHQPMTHSEHASEDRQTVEH